MKNLKFRKIIQKVAVAQETFAILAWAKMPYEWKTTVDELGIESEVAFEIHEVKYLYRLNLDLWLVTMYFEIQGKKWHKVN